jgi:hypothetical protein
VVSRPIIRELHRFLSISRLRPYRLCERAEAGCPYEVLSPRSWTSRLNNCQLASSPICVRPTGRSSIHSQPVARCEGCVTRNQQPVKVALMDQLCMSSKRRSFCRGLGRVCLSCRTQIAKLLVGVLRCVKARFAVSPLFRRGERTEPLFVEMQLMHLGHLGPAALPSPTY